ncbi:MAG: hypothetical protein GY715_15575 [Planctomycetes bacterium]|nr:hypothetical protein [Planctomycetota bacterium]
MTTVTPLGALLLHGDWARDRLMAVSSPLPGAALDRPFELGPGSLRRTLHHLWRSEHVWLDRWSGNTITDPGEGELMTMDALWACFRDTARARDAFLDNLDAEDFARRCTYTRPDGGSYKIPIGDAVLHVVNHGFHHRAQALNMLRHLDGVEPPAGIDFLRMARDPRHRMDIVYDAETIGEYLRYGDWADESVLDIADDLDDAALDRPFEMGLGSLRKVLLHVRAAAQWWLGAWRGEDASFPKLPETTSTAELRGLVEDTAAARRELMATLSNADLERTVTARPRPDREMTVRIGDTMIQLGGHGTHHRAHALNMLRHLGAASPGIGYRNWCEETALAGRVG